MTHRPDSVGVERLFFNKNVQTAFAVGQARGVVLLAAAEHGLPVLRVRPTRGQGRRNRLRPRRQEQVQRMVQVVLGMDELPRPDDAADALAVAICLAHARPWPA